MTISVSNYLRKRLERILEGIKESLSQRRRDHIGGLAENKEARGKPYLNKFSPVYFMRRMRQENAKGARVVGWFAGAKMVRRIADGNPRRFIQIMNAFVEQAREGELDPKDQYRVLTRFSKLVLGESEALQQYGLVLHGLIDQIGKLLSERVHGDRTQSAWLHAASNYPAKQRLFIATSGYEARNIYWIEKILAEPALKGNASFLVVGFEDFPADLSRPQNDEFYRENGLDLFLVNSGNQEEFLQRVSRAIEKLLADSTGKPVEVHVDYSCMPRLWYCRLPLLIEKALRRQDEAYFWYTLGIYPETEYPTAGVEDFHVFSGKPSLGASFRTHIFGLGFDRTRSQAIWSIIDPQNLICFYADPPAKPEYVDRVEDDNRNVLSAANYKFTVPINDFVLAYSKLAAVASEFRDLGDVIIVPDGPKPLILATFSPTPTRQGRDHLFSR